MQRRCLLLIIAAAYLLLLAFHWLYELEQRVQRLEREPPTSVEFYSR